MRGYNKTGINTSINKNSFEDVFKEGTSIVLLKTTNNESEVKVSNYTTLYLKTSSLDNG